MTGNPVCIDPERVAHTLRQEAAEQVTGERREVILDFSAVKQVDVDTIYAMEELAALARERSVSLVLQGVSLEIYKVLKLMKLPDQFVFQSAR